VKPFALGGALVLTLWAGCARADTTINAAAPLPLMTATPP